MTDERKVEEVLRSNNLYQILRKAEEVLRSNNRYQIWLNKEGLNIDAFKGKINEKELE